MFGNDQGIFRIHRVRPLARRAQRAGEVLITLAKKKFSWETRRWGRLISVFDELAVAVVVPLEIVTLPPVSRFHLVRP